MLLHYNFEQENGTTIKDMSGNGNDGVIKGSGYTISDGEMVFPGGAAGNSAAYVQLPTGMFDNQDTLTISLWLKNETGKDQLPYEDIKETDWNIYFSGKLLKEVTSFFIVTIIFMQS